MSGASRHLNARANQRTRWGARCTIVATVAVIASLVGFTAASADTGPAIVSAPVDATVGEGAMATFTAAATGDPEPTVQWERSNDVGATYAPIPGATSTTFSLTATAADHGAKFRAQFSNSTGTVSTNNATLAVWLLPAVTEHPATRTAAVGETVLFSSDATSDAELTVQWERSNDGGITWADIAAATDSSYSTGALTTAFNGARFRAAFTNAAGTVRSNVAVLTVGSTMPTITQQPSSATISAGATATFTADATGAPMPQRQWQRAAAGGSFFDIAGATGPTYTSPVAAAADTGARFRLRAANNNGIKYSDEAVLTVQSAPVITTSPVGRLVVPGTYVVFTVAGVGSPTPTIQWQRSADNGTTWIDLAGETATGYAFTASAPQSGLRFRAVLTNVYGAATSTVATLTVGTVPSFPQQPSSPSAAAGDPATFSVTVAGTPVPTLQWQTSIDEGTTWTNVSGATSNSLTVTALTNDRQRYRVVATNAIGSVPSSAARVILLTAATITAQPQNVAVSPGASATFSVIHTGGTAPVTVQWQRRAYNVTAWTDIAGATNDAYTLTAALADILTSYRAVISSPGGATTSEAATLDVLAGPTIGVHPADALGVSTAPAFSFVGDGWTSGHWERSLDNGVTWVTVTTFVAPSAGTGSCACNTLSGDGALMRVVLDNPHGSITSTTALIRFNSAPVVSIQPVGLPVSLVGSNNGLYASVGTSVTLIANITRAYPDEITSITWKRCSPPSLNCTTYSTTGPVLSFTMSGSDNGRLVGVTATNSVGSTTYYLAMAVTVPYTFTAPQSVTTAAGNSAQFTASATVPSGSTPFASWEFSSDGGQTWTSAGLAPSTTVGTTLTSVLTLPAVDASWNGRQYRLVRTQGPYLAASDAATLTVVAPPVLTVTPAGSTLQGTNVPVSYSCEPAYAIESCVAGVVDGDAPDPIPAGYTPPAQFASGAALDTSTVGRQTVIVRGINSFGGTTYATSVFDVLPGGTTATTADGGTLSTGGTPTVGDVLTTTVTTPIGGFSRILEGAPTATAPTGYSWFGLQTEVSAPIQTAAAPLATVVQAHGTLLAGTPAASVLVWRNGVLVPNCPGGTAATTASPNPCIKQRLPLTGGGAKITILGTSGGIINIGKLTATSPGSPASVAATAGVRTITVTWAPPTDDGGAPISSHTVVLTPINPAGAARTVVVSAPTNTATITSLANGADYTVAVKARNTINATYGALSAATPVRTPALPSAPTDVATSAGPGSLTATWTPGPSDSPITKYTVTATGTRPDTTIHTVTKSVTGTPPVSTATLPGLTAGLSYTATVRATSAVGTGAASAASNPVAPAIGVSIGDRAAIEGSAPLKGFIFTITLSSAPTTDVRVDVTTGHVTTDAADLNHLATTVVFSAAQKSKTIIVYVKGDTVAEPNETFNVILSNPVGMLINDGTGLGTITNDD